MPAFEVLGPLQISLGRMLGDITRFLVLFTLVIDEENNFILKKTKDFQIPFAPCRAIDCILKLMTVWNITGKIIRTTINVT